MLGSSRSSNRSFINVSSGTKTTGKNARPSVEKYTSLPEDGTELTDYTDALAVRAGEIPKSSVKVHIHLILFSGLWIRGGLKFL